MYNGCNAGHELHLFHEGPHVGDVIQADAPAAEQSDVRELVEALTVNREGGDRGRGVGRTRCEPSVLVSPASPPR
jgi:hypothetical protein